MSTELLTKLELVSKDKYFFNNNKDKITKSFNFFDAALSKYIDICCLKFKTFIVNKTSYIYGSIITLSLAFVLAANENFKVNKRDALTYFERDIFPMFIEEYYTENLVSPSTQSHMLRGYIDEFDDIFTKRQKYCGGKYDQYFEKEYPDYISYYLNIIISYCVERKGSEFTIEDVVNELKPLIVNIF